MRPHEEDRRLFLNLRGAWLGLLLLLALSACAPSRSIVPILAERSERQRLVGTWSGKYTGANSSSGTITLVLATNTDSAFGEVVMLDDRQHRPFVPAPYPLTEEDHLTHKQVLPIRFIRLAGNRVSGELAAYVDAVSGCAITTTFEGYLARDEITGTFLSRYVGSLETHKGTWKVRRKKARDET